MLHVIIIVVYALGACGLRGGLWRRGCMRRSCPRVSAKWLTRAEWIERVATRLSLSNIHPGHSVPAHLSFVLSSRGWPGAPVTPSPKQKYKTAADGLIL